MRKIIGLLFLSVCCFGAPAFAQNCNCPEFSLPGTKSPDKSSLALKLLNSSNDNCRAKGCEIKALLMKESGNTDSAVYFLQQAENIYRKSKCPDSLYIPVYKLWGQLMHAAGDIAGAQDRFIQLADVAEKAGNLYEQAISYTMIAQMFNQSNLAPKGIIYTRKAAVIAEKITDPLKKTEVYFRISKRLLWHFQETKTMNSLDSSELYSQRQLTLARKENLKTYISSALANLHGVSWERWALRKDQLSEQENKKILEQLLIQIDTALKYTDTTTFNVMGALYADKADNLLSLKRYDEAKIAADLSIYYRDKTGNIAYREYGYEILKGVYKGKNDYRKAYEYYEKATHLRDSLGNIEKVKQVSELERKYNQAKNEKTIKELAQQKRIYVLLAAAGLFAFIGLVLFIRQQSLRNKKKILETEQRLNRARMNPHFFFNALSSLQAFAMQGNDGKSIATNLSKFSHIMRETLESTYKDYVTIEQETDFLNEYLELQKIRFPQKFTYDITLSKNIEPDEILIPSMILQPFAENSIEHGFTGIDYAGHLSISFDQQGKDLLVTITDNGKGLPSLPKENSEHISRASQIIKDRIYLLNIKLKTKAAFSIDNNPDGKGVLVKIILPVIYKNQMS